MSLTVLVIEAVRSGKTKGVMMEGIKCAVEFVEFSGTGTTIIALVVIWLVAMLVFALVLGGRDE